MAQEEFYRFVEECRQVGLADVKALEAAWDQFKSAASGPGEGDLVARLLGLARLGAEYARFEDKVREGENHGC